MRDPLFFSKLRVLLCGWRWRHYRQASWLKARLRRLRHLTERSLRNGLRTSRPLPPASRFFIEPLEPRVLLAADLTGVILSSALIDPAVPGSPASAVVQVQNIGDQSVIQSQVGVYASLDTILDSSDTLLGTAFTNNAINGTGGGGVAGQLSPGKSRNITVNLTIPSTFDAIAYRLLAKVDNANTIAENSEANNVAIGGKMNVVWQFGDVPGRSGNTQLTLRDADGTDVTFKLSSSGLPGAPLGVGLGKVIRDGANWDIKVTGTSGYSVMTIDTAGGSIVGVTLDDVHVFGPLYVFKATTTILTGTLAIDGPVRGIELGGIQGGTVAVPSVNGLTIKGNVTNANLYIGTTFGQDGQPGGTGANADSYGQGSIGLFEVTGNPAFGIKRPSVTGTTVRVGVDPVDGIYGNGNDTIIGGTASSIGSITVRGQLSTDSRIIAGALPASASIDGQLVTDLANDLRFSTDVTSPILTAGLAQDTGNSSTDRLTNTPTITGSLIDAGVIAKFTAGFGASPTFDVLPARQAKNGSFILDRASLELINGGGKLTDGTYVLKLLATDTKGNSTQLTVPFTLDTTAPSKLTLGLDPTSDTDPKGDQQTTAATVTLVGQTDEALATVLLLETNQTTTADAGGNFSFSNVALTLGANVFTVRATDAAGNQRTTAQTITRTVQNSAPVAVDDTYALAGGTLTVGAGAGLLANDRDPDGALLVASMGIEPAGGQVDINSDGSFTYRASSTFTGSDSFIYQVSDGGLHSIATVTITGQAPVAGDDTYVLAGGTLTVGAGAGLLANDRDPDGALLVASMGIEPAGGQVDINSDGSFTYRASSTFTGSDSFIYQVSDGGLHSIATVTITGQAPVAGDDTYVLAGGTLTVGAGAGLLANDRDPDGAPLVASMGIEPAGGQVDINSDGSFTYRASSTFTGSDSFIYQVSDGGLHSIATVTITGQAPVAGDDTYVLAGGTLTVGAGAGLLANDRDPDGAPLVASMGIEPAGGQVDINSDGSFTYRASSTFTGSDSFTYRAWDGGLFSTLATVTITDQAPVAVDDSYTIAGASLSISLSSLVANDTDADSHSLVLNFSSSPSHGTLTAGEFFSGYVYTPDASFTGTDTFTYSVTDGVLTSNLATVTITGQAPVAADDTYVLAGGTLTVGAGAGLLANDRDPDGALLVASMGIEPAGGQVDINSDGSFTYRASSTFTGSDSFIYQVSDGGLHSIATVTITGQAPVAGDDTYVLAGGTLTVGAGAGLLANDRDPDGAPLVASMGIEPAGGQVDINSDGSFTYRASSTFTGSDSFIYQAWDGGLHSIATVTITGQAPVAGDDTYVLAGGTLTVGAGAGLLANDRDPDGAPLVASMGTEPVNGRLDFNTVNSDGSFTYRASSTFTGSDSFTYRAWDGGLFSTLATVTIIGQAPANAAPVITSNGGGATAVISVPENTTAVTTVTAADSDDDALTFALVGGADQARFAINATTGVLTFATAPNFESQTDANADNVYDVVVQVTDGSGGVDTQTLAVTVTNVNEAPVAVDDTYAFAGGVLTVAVPGVLRNDTDPDGDPLKADLSSLPAHGSLYSFNGGFTYIVEAGFSGTDSFTYQVIDEGGLGSNMATVTITDPAWVIAGDDTYAIVGGSLEVMEPGVLLNDSNQFGHASPPEVVLFSGPTHGDLSLRAGGGFKYTAGEGFPGIDSFTYLVTVGGVLASNRATVTITSQAPANAAPVITSNGGGVTAAISVPENTTTVTTVTAADSDGDALTFSLMGGADQARFAINATTGVLTFATAPDFESPSDSNVDNVYEVVVQVSDGGGGVDTQTLAVTVTNANDAPVGVADSYQMRQGTTLTVPASGVPGVLANDTDPDGDVVTAFQPRFIGSGEPVPTTQGFAFTLLPDGSFTYTPPADFVGTDSFVYTVTDGLAGTVNIPVTITVRPNAAPVGVADSYQMRQGTTLTVAAPGVLANDTDADGDVVTAFQPRFIGSGEPVPTTQGFAFTLLPDGSFTYTPPADFVGTDSFVYTVTDGQTGTTGIEVTIDVLPNRPPVGVADSYQMRQGTTLTVPASGVPGVLANDTDPDGDVVTAFQPRVIGSGEPAPTTQGFAFTLLPDSSFTYTPPADFVGTDSFVYTVTDGQTGTTGIEVTIDVLPNRPPVGVADSYQMRQGTTLTVPASGVPGVLANDTDPDGDVVTAFQPRVIGSGEPAPTTQGFAFTLLPDGSFTYTPPADFVGTDSFVYTVTDGQTGTAGIQVTITVTDANDPPVLSGIPTGTQAVTVGQIVTFTATATDADIPANVLTFSLQGTVPTGASIDSSTGAFSWTATAGQEGQHTITVRVTDNGRPNLFAEQQVIVQVNPVVTSARWINANGGDWNVASNWDSGVVPGVNDDVTIDLAVSNPITFSSGALQVRSLTMSAGQLVVSGSTLLEALTLSGGTVIFDGNAAITTLNQSGGELNGAGVVTLTGAGVAASTWSGGAMSGSGQTIVQGSLVSNGSVNELVRALVVGNEATVNVQSGRLRLLGGSTTQDGNYHVADGATLDIHGGGVFEFTGNGGISGSGTVEAVFGFFKRGAGTTTTITPTVINFGFVEVLSGTVVLTGTVTNHGTLRVEAGAMLTISGNLTNYDDATHTLTGGQVTGATFIIGGTLRVANADIMTNAAAIVLDGLSSQFLNDTTGADALAGLTTNDGFFTLTNGAIFTTAGALTNTSGFLVLEPGSTLTVAGTLDSVGVVSINITGASTSQFGRLVVNGTANLFNSDLSVEFVNGFIPAVGARFQFMTFASRTGAFSNTVLPNGTTLDESDPTDLKLVVTTVVSVTPNAAPQGQANLDVAIVSTGSKFDQLLTTVNFGDGVIVNSVTVTDATHLTANVSIDAGAVLGPRTVTVDSNIEAFSLVDGFTVTPAGVTRSWTNLNGGNWNDPGNWDGGVLPGSNDDVIIDGLGTFTVTHSTGDTTVKSITTNHPIDLTGGTLTVTGTLQLTDTALTLNGGTLAQATVDSRLVNGTDGSPIGIVVSSGPGGTLDGVKMVGTQFDASKIVVDATATLTIRNGLVLSGSLSIWGSVRVEGAQAITGLTVTSLGFIDVEAGGVLAAATPGEILMLGARLTIRGIGGTIGTDSTEVVNSGGINGSLTFFNLSNLGVLNPDLSSTTVVHGFLVNSGTVVLSDGSVVHVDGDFTNDATGTVIAAFNILGQFGTLDIRGTAILDGTLIISGSDPFFNPTASSYRFMSFFGGRSPAYFTTTIVSNFAPGLSVTVDQSNPLGLDIVVN